MEDRMSAYRCAIYIEEMCGTALEKAAGLLPEGEVLDGVESLLSELREMPEK